MSVRNGFTIEIYGFKHSLRTYLLARAAQDAIAQWHGASRSRIEHDARTSPDVWKTVNCSGCHCTMAWRIEVEDRRRCQNKSRCMEDG